MNFFLFGIPLFRGQWGFLGFVIFWDLSVNLGAVLAL